MTDVLFICVLIAFSGLGIGLPFLRRTGQTDSQASETRLERARQRGALREAVVELEMDRSMGKISADEYVELKNALLKKLQALEGRPAGPVRNRDEHMDEAIEEEIRQARAARKPGSTGGRKDTP